MKQRSRSVLFASLVLGLALNSCKKTNDAPGGSGAFTAKATFTIDGDGFKKQAITITGVKGAGLNYCYYSSKDDVTGVGIDDAPTINIQAKNSVTIIFNGDKPGAQDAGDDINGGPYSSVYFQVMVTSTSGVQHTYLFEDASNTPGKITITKFGNPLDTVEGTFSGTLVDENGDPNIKITNGTFSITRAKNID